MQYVTLRVIQGADRGRVFHELKTPITIGREDGNTVQLNDERISRFHVKIQEDDDSLVVTDLDSTNGTRINGELCSLKLIKQGDTIAVGRSMLLVGNRELVGTVAVGDDYQPEEEEGESTGIHPRADGSSIGSLQIPKSLRPVQLAQLRELLDAIHRANRHVIESAERNPDSSDEEVILKAQPWMQLLDLQSELSVLIRAIEDPDSRIPDAQSSE